MTFRRFGRRDDALELRLHAGEVELLRDLLGQVDGMLEGGPPDHGSEAVRDRLFPRAYLDPTADVEEGEFQSAVHDDLVRAKSDAVGAVVATLEAGRAERDGSVTVRLADEEVERWASALNDVRLALGVTFDVTEDLDLEGLAPDDPRRSGLEVYAWLTALQGMLVEVLLGGLPDPGRA